MSKSDKKASAAEPDGHQSDSVLDFLYNDVRRVGSFLAQFDESGHLQRVVQRESASLGQKRGLKVNLSGGANVLGTGGSGGIGIERGPLEGGAEGQEREYDPLWANARTLLDFLEGDHLIQKDVASARIGQFLLAKGRLAITDLAIMKRAMGLSSVKKTMSASQPKGAGRQTALAAQTFALEMLTILPHNAQGRLYTTDGQLLWAGLGASYLTVAAEDIFLQHGVLISGEWHMLGVVDAIPGPYGEPDATISIFDAIREEDPGTELLARVLPTLVPFTKQTLGRPETAYGITPLLIFREVSSG